MKPMLALVWGERPMPFPILLSPKIDGIRCMAHFTKEGIKLMSRQGKPISSMQHIERQLEALSFPIGTILDGELYLHDDAFQRISGVIRTKKPTPASMEEAKQIKYHVYDIAAHPENVQRHPYQYRRRYVRDGITEGKTRFTLPGLLFWDSVLVTDQGEFDELTAAHRNSGYEGSMARPFGKEDYYQSKDYGHSERSAFLLKVKIFDDAEYTIVGIEEEKDLAGTPKGRTGKFVMEGDGVKFRASGLTDELKEDSWQNKEKYIGRVCTIKYFGKSLGGVPRHPNFVRFRDPGEIS